MIKKDSMRSTVYIRSTGEGVRLDFSEQAGRLTLPNHYVGSAFLGALGVLGLQTKTQIDGVFPSLQIIGDSATTIANADQLLDEARDIAKESSQFYWGDRAAQRERSTAVLKHIGSTIGRMPDGVSLSVLVGAVAGPLAQELNPKDGAVTVFEQSPAWLNRQEPAAMAAA